MIESYNMSIGELTHLLYQLEADGIIVILKPQPPDDGELSVFVSKSVRNFIDNTFTFNIPMSKRGYGHQTRNRRNHMTKKHFIALADHLNAKLSRDAAIDYDYLVEVLADFCKSQNPRFNRDRWLAYLRRECGPNGGARR